MFQLCQFGLAFVQAIADQHQVLQAVAVSGPGIGQGRQRGAALKVVGQALQALGNFGLFGLQRAEARLAFAAGGGLLLLVGAVLG